MQKLAVCLRKLRKQKHYRIFLSKGRNPHMQRYTCTYFAISEQCYHLTSTDAEAVDVRSVDAPAVSQEEADART